MRSFFVNIFYLIGKFVLYDLFMNRNKFLCCGDGLSFVYNEKYFLVYF